MKILIFGGTTEGRDLSLNLAREGADVTVSVVSDLGAEELKQFAAKMDGFGADGYLLPDSKGSLTISSGPKEIDDMRAMMRDADFCVDATHPYAVVVSNNIRQAAEQENLELLRVLRESDNLPAQDSAGESILLAESAAEAGEKAKALGERVLLTTGSKDLQSFAQVLDPKSLYPRVLPLGKSIQACEEAGIPHRNIIAIQGPFSEELNKAIIKEYDIQVMITKESGKAGGFSEKIEACKACHIPVIVIARPEDAGLAYEEVLALCREKMK